MHSGFILHCICTWKTACFILLCLCVVNYCIRSFTQLSLFEDVHFLIIHIPYFFFHCVCCIVLGFAMQLHSMLFTFIRLFGILVVQTYVTFESITRLLYVGSSDPWIVFLFFLKKLCRPDDPTKNNYSTVSSIVLDYLPTEKEHFSFQYSFEVRDQRLKPVKGTAHDQWAAQHRWARLPSANWNGWFVS